MKRRTVLLVAGSAVTGLAGCLGDGDGDTTETPEPAQTERQTPSPTETATPTPTPEKTATPEETATPTPDTPEDAVEAGKQLVGDMADGAFPQALGRFRSDAQQGLSAGRIEELWLAYTAVGGPFQRIGETEEIVQGGFDGVDMALEFERGTHVMRVLVDNEEGFSTVGIFANDQYQRPDYVDTERFNIKEATVETESCLMDATLTVPTDAQDVPGVVLVHGSDPPAIGGADKDLSTGGSKPFKDMAEGLSSRGVAVLRYDRRSHACPNSLSAAEWTLDAITVDDPLVALEQLRGVDAVDSTRTVVAGSSLGGLAAPRIAKRDEDLAGIAMLAGPARNFYEIFIEQFDHLATVGEYEWTQMANVHERWKDRIDRIRNGDYSDGDIILDYPGALWRTVDEYDQIGTAQEIDTPAFILQGDRDYQVSPEEDFGRWQTELADRPDTQFQLYENLNHIFQYAEGPSTRSEYSLANPVDKSVIEDIASWTQSL
ncbi:alpha/beta hydrolase family protein [Halovenus rubra]|uniref:Alpha/beta hydrolase family protein n=2 Tax=Halovenus rubra TaxID=869890 RepID=A0ABD5XFS0_9EURY|nr:alpha/beta hydrolase [Halovenus rubra]